MAALFITIFASLFSVVNPLGAVPVYLAMTPDETPRDRRFLALKTSLWFSGILIAFFLAGTYILSFFGISLDALRIAGGLVILNSGYALLSGKFESNRVGSKVKKEAVEKEDISFTPMAMPMLSGPGSISLLISEFLLHPTWGERMLIIGVVLTLGLVVFLILWSAPQLFKLLGKSGLKAISRMMGFLVMAIGVQYVIGGVVGLVENLTSSI